MRFFDDFGRDPASLGVGFAVIAGLVAAALFLPGLSLFLWLAAVCFEAFLIARRYSRFITPANAALSQSVNMLVCLALTRLVHAFLWLVGLFALVMIAASLTAGAGVDAGAAPMTPEAFQAALGSGGQGLLLLLLLIICAYMFYADRRLMLAQALTVRDGRLRVMMSFQATKTTWRSIEWRREGVRALSVVLIALALALPALRHEATVVNPLILGVTIGLCGWLGAVLGVPARADLLSATRD